MSQDLDFSRRKFLKNSSFLAGAAVVMGVTGCHNKNQTAEAPVAPADIMEPEPITAAPSTDRGDHKVYRGKMFFTNELEFATLAQAAQRIFPADDTGPGAIELAVPYFIDNQLAGAWGHNAREFMLGPYYEGTATQGYQTPLFRKDIFQQGIIALNRQSNADYNADFPDLTDTQKDDILKKCESGNIPTNGFASSYFFSLLRTAVLAGAYADPIYNGNNNMDGWRMKHYPGAQMHYLGIVDNPDFEIIEPLSLADMDHL